MPWNIQLTMIFPEWTVGKFRILRQAWKNIFFSGLTSACRPSSIDLDSLISAHVVQNPSFKVVKLDVKTHLQETTLACFQMLEN